MTFSAAELFLWMEGAISLLEAYRSVMCEGHFNDVFNIEILLLVAPGPMSTKACRFSYSPFLLNKSIRLNDFFQQIIEIDEKDILYASKLVHKNTSTYPKKREAKKTSNHRFNFLS